MKTASLFRAAAAEAEGIDLAAGTARLSFSSELPVLRRNDAKYGTHVEVLSHAPGDINNAILERGAPVLLNHDPKTVIGTVERGSFQVGSDRRGRATIRVYPEWRSYLEAIKTGEAPNQVSVGYGTTGVIRRETGPDGLPVLVFSWLPEEISILTAGHPPADPRLGLGRSATMKNSLEQILQLALSGSRQATDDFSDVSLVDTINQLGRAPSGRVREMHEALTHLGGEPISRGVHFSALAPLRRDSTVGIFPAGGALVAHDLHEGTPLVFNKSIIRGLGATFVTGLHGNFDKPRATTAPTVQSLSETAAVTASNILTALDSVGPKRLTAQVVIGKQWLKQSGPSAEAYVRGLIAEAVNTELDRLAIFGNNPDEPVGLMATPGVQSIVFGGAPTWAKILEAEQKVADVNLDSGRLGWAVSGSTRAKWKQTPKIDGYPKFLMSGGEVADYPALSTSQLSGSHQMIFGAWDSFLVLVWGDGMDFVADPYTLASTARVKLTVCMFVNVLPLYTQAFVISADAANQ